MDVGGTAFGSGQFVVSALATLTTLENTMRPFNDPLKTLKVAFRLVVFLTLMETGVILTLLPTTIFNGILAQLGMAWIIQCAICFILVILENFLSRFR